MLERGVRIPALLSCFRLSSGFVSGFGHSCSRFGLAVGACGLEFTRAVRSSVRVHFVLFGTQFGCVIFQFLVLLHAARFSAACFLLFCLVLCGTQFVFLTGCVLSFLSCQEFYTPVCYCGEISTPLNTMRHKTKCDWMLYLSVKWPLGRVLGIQSRQSSHNFSHQSEGLAT